MTMTLFHISLVVIRAQGHKCGCLSVMTRMIMERLVIRLDIAMFNAILRESAEEMSSGPLSDPITEPRVLPIVARNLSFGAGAQLKNAIGNWTRWLSDLFETEDIDSPNDDECCSDETTPASFKAFRLLNALSDVMMLPFEMVTDKSTRKEVCPALGPAMIKRVFSSFFPDQFCPYPIPQSVIDALDYEDDLDISPEVVGSHPCTAPPTVYSPPFKYRTHYHLKLLKLEKMSAALEGLSCLEAGYQEKVEELCTRYSLEGFINFKDTEAHSLSNNYLRLDELAVEDVVWVDDSTTLSAATVEIEECKVVFYNSC